MLGVTDVCRIAGISEQIGDKPVGVEILGEKLVLFRDRHGVVQAMDSTCVHRGAQLDQVHCCPIHSQAEREESHAMLHNLAHLCCLCRE